VDVTPESVEIARSEGAPVVLGEGEVVIGVGTAEEMRRLEELFAPREHSLA
jgi:hypothetical protein